MAPKGFTLIEMVVSLGVFTAVILISLAALLSVSGAQKEAVAAQNNIGNLRFSLDAMAREIKAGRNFDCNKATLGLDDCNYAFGGTTELTFINNEGKTVTYFVGDKQLRRETISPCDVGPIYCPITAKEVRITRLVFYVSGAPLGDLKQPHILIVMDGETAGFKAGQVAKFNLQTSLASRHLDR